MAQARSSNVSEFHFVLRPFTRRVRGKQPNTFLLNRPEHFSLSFKYGFGEHDGNSKSDRKMASKSLFNSKSLS